MIHSGVLYISKRREARSS